MARLALGFLLGFFFYGAGGWADAPRVSAVEAEGYAAVGPLLKSADGKLTPEVRRAYLDWAAQVVLRQLKEGQQTIPDDCLSEVQKDDALRAALFGGVYPPDPSVLQNYASLSARLDDKIVARYRSLIVAIAIARRVKRVEKGEELARIGHDYQPDFWEDESLQTPGSDEERAFVRAIADFLQKSGVSASDLYERADLQEKLKAELTEKKIGANLVREVGRSLGFGERLKYALVLCGQRPAAREPKPDIVSWIRALVERNEATPQSVPTVDGRPMTWPLFPLATAPWPLLMPLAHTVPLSEAQYMWEAFQGKHGPDRFHTYGPYRVGEDVIPDSLRPSRWHWDAWPDRIVHGGMCVPISKGTVDLYTGLGKPAMWAGQPGHANLITFQYVRDSWTAEIEQAFAGGPEVTNGQWYFEEELHSLLRFRDLYHWPGSEYHLGLALAMNVGLSSYADTRIAAHLYRLLPAEEQKTVGQRLLQSAAETNPYNPDLWYRAAERTPDAPSAVALVEAAMRKDAALLDGPSGSALRSVSGVRDQYWNTLIPFVARYALLSQPAPRDRATRRLVYATLQNVPGLRGEELADYAETFAQPSAPGTPADALSEERQAMRDGEALGYVRMGQRYRDGDGVARSAERAREFFSKAVGRRDRAAAVLLSRLDPCLPSEGITATASSVFGSDQAVGHLIDGSGMTGSAHDNEGAARTMWHSAERRENRAPVNGLPPAAAWVRFDFREPVRCDSLQIWNHNQESLTDRGFRYCRLYGTTDGVRWVPLANAEVIELPRAEGRPDALPTDIPFRVPGVRLKAVLLAAELNGGNYGGTCYGLSAVRFILHRLPPTIPARQIAVRASSEFSSDQSVRHLTDGSGLTGNLHDNDNAAKTMWHTTPGAAFSRPAPGLPASPAWVRFDFARPARVAAVLLWNHNQIKLTDRGFQKVRIYGTTDNVNWRPLTAATTLPRASGVSLIEPISVPNDAPERALKAVIVSAEAVGGNYGGDCYGLSAVRFVPAP